MKNFRHELETIAALKNPDMEYLETSRLPLVLWGAAELAGYTKILLDAHDITIDSVVVDTPFWRPGQIFFDIPVSRWEEVRKKHAKINLIAAFVSGNYRERMAELQILPEVERCLRFSDGGSPFEFRSDFMARHQAALETLFHRFSDDLSRRVFFAFLRAKNLHNAKELAQLNIASEAQYFPDFLSPEASDIFVDCGAFDGDTIAQFCEWSQGGFRKIYAFECDPHNAGKLRENMSVLRQKCGGGGIFLIEKGVFSFPGQMSLGAGASECSHIDESGKVSIEVDSIDHVCEGEKVTFIKMDIEGAELEALKGARNTIRRHRPKLAICVYHKPEDLVTIPQYILSLHEDYRLYLRHYGDLCTEVVLYAT
jgi:FkbM family methyltransferase